MGVIQLEKKFSADHMHKPSAGMEQKQSYGEISKLEKVSSPISGLYCGVALVNGMLIKRCLEFALATKSDVLFSYLMLDPTCLKSGFLKRVERGKRLCFPSRLPLKPRISPRQA